MSELEPKTAPVENLSGLTTTAAPRPPSTGCFFEKLLLDEEDSRARIWKCPYPAERDGLCIYHLRKPSVDERSTLTATELSTAEQLDTRCRTELAALFAKTQQSESATAHEFIGFEIPPGFGLSDQKIIKRLNLRFARFCGDAGFALCEVRTADFRNVEFCGRATFAYVEFHDGVQFHDARFCGVAEFSSVRFQGRTIFAGANFQQGCTFHLDNGGFENYANFNRVRFEARSGFVGYGDEPVFRGQASFCDLSFAGGVSLSFTNVSLAYADFYNTDLGSVRFISVRWNTLNGRPSLWGEVRLLKIDCDPVARKQYGIPDWDKPPLVEHLAENYAQLVLNYEQRRDVDTAEAFHIGEMEMRRRKVASGITQPWLRMIRERCNGFAVYSLSSKYGTSYTRAATVLVISVLFLSLLFLWAGIMPVGAASGDQQLQSAPAVIQYRLLPDATHSPVGPRQWLEDYVKALVFTLSVVTFQKDRYFQPANRASEVLAMLAVILVGAQAALLLFAVPRRFKR